MLNKLIDWSARNRFLVLLATLFIIAAGTLAVLRPPIAAPPALSAAQSNAISKTSISPTTCSTPNCSAHPTPASRRRRRVRWPNATSW